MQRVLGDGRGVVADVGSTRQSSTIPVFSAGSQGERLVKRRPVGVNMDRCVKGTVHVEPHGAREIRVRQTGNVH